jgi:CTP synthase (UTP-ammonia lyase)
MEDAASGTPLITEITCAVGEVRSSGPMLAGNMKVTLGPESRVSRVCGELEIWEEHGCSFNLNPDFRRSFQAKGLRIVGHGEDGEARVIELDGHRFFVGTLFLPQFGSEEGRPHPIINAYLRAVREFSETC